MKNINSTHKKSLNALSFEIANLSAEMGGKTLELECLEIAREAYIKKKDWVKVASYNRRIMTLKSELEDRGAYIDIRVNEYDRLKATAENENLVETYILKNPQLAQHA